MINDKDKLLIYCILYISSCKQMREYINFKSWDKIETNYRENICIIIIKEKKRKCLP